MTILKDGWMDGWIDGWVDGCLLCLQSHRKSYHIVATEIDIAT